MRTALPLAMLAASMWAQRWATLPPIPANPNEPLSGAVQLLQTPAERAAGLNLLNIAGQDYTFLQQGRPDIVIEARLQSSGNLRYEGSGTMTEIAVGRRRTWWADFAGERSGIGDDLRSHPIPMRVVLARWALLWPIPRQPTLNEIRVAGAEINRRPVTCVLVNQAATLPTVAGRDWREEEYCMDATGLLQMASPAPGVYINYDYNGALHYAGHTVASTIHVIEGQNLVLTEQVTRLEAPNANDQQTMQDAKPGPSLLSTSFAGLFPPGGTATKVDVVHLTLYEGQVLEAEVIANGSPLSEDAALRKWQQEAPRFARNWRQPWEVELWLRDARP